MEVRACRKIMLAQRVRCAPSVEFITFLHLAIVEAECMLRVSAHARLDHRLH